MNKSDEINEIVKALFNAQQELPDIPMRGINPHFKSRFMKLGDIMDAVKKIFPKHGLMISQMPYYHSGFEGSIPYVCLDTVIFHAPSGQWISSSSGSPSKTDPQGTGAAITYLRRFGLVSMLFLAEEDDDGESAMDRKKDIPMAANQPETSITQTTLNALSTMIVVRSVSQAEQDTWLARANVAGIDKLTEQQAQKLLTMLENRK